LLSLVKLVNVLVKEVNDPTPQAWCSTLIQLDTTPSFLITFDGSIGGLSGGQFLKPFWTELSLCSTFALLCRAFVDDLLAGMSSVKH
jgi:hypothetical protein